VPEERKAPVPPLTAFHVQVSPNLTRESPPSLADRHSPG